MRQGTSAAGFVGAYIWGGTETNRHGSGSALRFYDSVEHALAAGFDTIRFKVGVGQVDDYTLGPDPCVGRQSLACYAQVMFASPVWDNPRLRRVIITTIDFACDTYRDGNGNGCLVASQLTANRLAIRAEYADLYKILKVRFGARPIQFIIDNWEGDNFAYCGDSYRFATNADGFSETCRASWPRGQTNQQRVQAVLQWVSYKQAEATRFLAANPTFDLKVAVEFNVYSLFAAQCPRSGVCDAATDTVLDAVAAAGGVPYCSWSSYDSEGPSNGSYFAAAKAIAKVCKALIVGEAGYDLGHVPKRTVIDLFEALYQIQTLPRVVGVVPWHAFDSEMGEGAYGLWTAGGRPQIIALMGRLHPSVHTDRRGGQKRGVACASEKNLRVQAWCTAR